MTINRPWVLLALLPPLWLVSAGSGVAEAQTLSERPAAAPPYPGSLPFFYDLYTFRGSGGVTLVAAAVAVEAGELEAERVDDGVGYRFNVSFVLADTLLKTVHRADGTVSVSATRPLRGEHLLHTQVTVEAPPSTHTMQRVVMTDPQAVGVGQLYDSSFPIPDYSGDTLMLSDIALGQPAGDEGWRRGDVSLSILPIGRFPGSTFEIYYEIYNLPPGHGYDTQVTVELLGDPGSASATESFGLRFQADARSGSGNTVQELRSISGQLEVGLYRMTVAVEDRVSGEVVTRTRLFQVRPTGDGTTPVIAVPPSGRR